MQRRRFVSKPNPTVHNGGKIPGGLWLMIFDEVKIRDGHERTPLGFFTSHFSLFTSLRTEGVDAVPGYNRMTEVRKISFSFVEEGEGRDR